MRSILLISLMLFCYSAKAQAVVELFTSEGCSSCPAADELLKTLYEKSESEGKPFIALSFHVTYWNNTGWIDPYSDETFTNRQKMYAGVLQKPRYYTPQAIVNGAHEFIGSNAVAFQDTLARVERKKHAYIIKATAFQKGDSVEIQYSLNKDSKNFQLNIAVVEKNSVREITRGENKNRTLRHFNVVRVFKTVDLKESDNEIMPWIKDLQPDNAEVILYVQHKKTLRIMGATKISLQKL
jgi:hypothetical protein